ncbi:YqiA/YcfP family alpha/beta fold hydrolase [Gilvimarinus algae]|uniref:YqiA/YcfP family alpha/beta fold hydrolase n=1 Tax=Gilvimarinus algae TaxID=3058037 RepID=A0ABT8T9U0_9GAMM|nr:YqiA/YcfP family alpha/beta fold hydrolase [Gilvimarinus sp. SDUM040014]MDO3380885.1 YqiA/YcfP family alpha/beta fold hydrolase [Gilvimarinus sp. SDUM040014]
MAAVIYLHGFLSSPHSHKATQVKQWIGAHAPDVTFHCPQLTPYPAQTQAELKALMEFLQPEPIWLIGSSLGGFWATWLAEHYHRPAVLVNPSVAPWQFMPRYLGVDLDAYHTDDSYRLEPEHLEQIRAADCAVIKRPDNYWLMVQTGDETLDYREAVAKYSACRQLVEEGGDHSFVGFERHLPEIIEFFRAFETASSD